MPPTEQVCSKRSGHCRLKLVRETGLKYFGSGMLKRQVVHNDPMQQRTGIRHLAGMSTGELSPPRVRSA